MIRLGLLLAFGLTAHCAAIRLTRLGTGALWANASTNVSANVSNNGTANVSGVVQKARVAGNVSTPGSGNSSATGGFLRTRLQLLPSALHSADEPPPSIKATPPPRAYEGTFVFCNLYPASYDFEVLDMKAMSVAKDAGVIATLGYKQCDQLSMRSTESVGLRAKGQLSGASEPIQKMPSVMTFGQFGKDNANVEFSRFFAAGDGPTVCNGFPVWETEGLGRPVRLLRGGYHGAPLTDLRYKECMPTGLQSGDVLAATIAGQPAGEYTVSGSPIAIVLGRDENTTTLSFVAWTGARSEPGL